MIRLSSIWRHSRPTSVLRRGTTCISTSIRDAHLAVNPGTISAPRLNNLLRPRNPQHPIGQRMSHIMNGKAETFGNFDLVKRVQLDYTDVVVSKWQSRMTGLSIVHLDFEGKHHQQSITFITTDSLMQPHL